MFYCLMHLYANFEMSHLATLESVLKCAIILSYHPPIPLAKPTPNSFKSAPKITPSKPPNSPPISYKQPQISPFKISQFIPFMPTCSPQICINSALNSALNSVLTLQKFREQYNWNAKWHNKEKTKKTPNKYLGYIISNS
jgi:hypothetical protein